MAKKQKVRKSKPSIYEQMARASNSHARVNHKSTRSAQKPSPSVTVHLSEAEQEQLLQLVTSKRVKPWPSQVIRP